MDLCNPLETVVHHLLMEGITCLDCWDEFPMVIALVYVMPTKKNLR